MRSPLRWFALAAFAIGCDDAVPASQPDASLTPPPTSSAVDPATRYAAMCASCHGEAGEGGLGTRLVDTPRSVAELTRAIDERMPQGNSAACRGECASSLAAYIKTSFTSQALACDVIPPGTRRMRLLNRREYRNTLRDLFGLGGSTAAPTPPADCNRRHFAYDPAGRTLRSVHLAGTFNGWSPTAWPMTRDAASGEWTLDQTVANGSHQYKFVLDGSEWVRDPRNAMTASDGFGGLNSLLTVACDAPVTTPSMRPTLAFDPAASFPVEARPQGFLFDDNADAALVTSVHVNEQLRAAGAVVDALGPQLRAIVGCDASVDAATCADRVTAGFARRAFRRALTGAEAQRYRALITGARDVDQGVRRAVRAMLVSPSFLYRSEMGEAQPDGTYRLSSYEIASALSYTYWGTMPDDALLDVAARNGLSDAGSIEREARRLLADPRAREQVGAFALQWLGVESVATTPRSAALFPELSDAVRAAMLEESRRFVSYVVFDGTHRFGELFTATDGFVNDALARYYGMTGVTGMDARRVALPAERRGGVLAEGAVMTRYAHSDQASPILRGVFVRVNLLCQEFPPPPANAGGVPDVDPTATTRQRFAQHTSNAACRSCHERIDGIGFGFEQFDAAGRTRATEAGMPIDHSGRLTDVEGFGTGSSLDFASPAELGAAIAASPTAQACFARQWFRFARGFRETASQRCAVRAAAQRLREHDGDLRELMLAVSLSPDFVNRR